MMGPFTGWSPAYSYFGLPSNRRVCWREGDYSGGFTPPSPFCSSSCLRCMFPIWWLFFIPSQFPRGSSLSVSFFLSVTANWKRWGEIPSTELFIRMEMEIINRHLCSLVVIRPDVVPHVSSEYCYINPHVAGAKSSPRYTELKTGRGDELTI